MQDFQLSPRCRRSLHFSNVARRGLVSDVSGNAYLSHLQRSNNQGISYLNARPLKMDFFVCLVVDVGTDKMSRNGGNKLSTYAA
jgi:hypothetical protein